MIIKVNTNSDKDKLRQEFEDSWKTLLGEILTDPDFENNSQLLDWTKFLLEQNVPGGKQGRALATVSFYRHLMPERTEEQNFLSYVLGWISEIRQAFCLIADDIMDGSTVRRGEPCWYTKSNIGLSAVNDAFLLENLTFRILQKYFAHNPKQYSLLLKLLLDSNLTTVLGQSLDTRISVDGNMKKFTYSTYDSIVKLKTSIYTFCTPVEMAMVLAGIDDPKVFEAVREVLCEIGHLFQVQDDYLDLYGNPAVTGKIGTDIIDKKCSWLIVTALEIANAEQREKLLEYYGDNESEDAELIVKNIYAELELGKIYQKYEKATYERIVEKIQSKPELEILQSPLVGLVDKIYQRVK